jgi:hypothetical protein
MDGRPVTYTAWKVAIKLTAVAVKDFILIAWKVMVWVSDLGE